MSVTRTQLEEYARAMAVTMDRTSPLKLGERIGFVLMVFDFGEKGNLVYISNAERAQMIGAVKEWLARQEARLTTDPPGPKAVA